MKIEHKLQDVLVYLHKIIPPDVKWFISGGFALACALHNDNYNDIDVFFETQKDIDTIKRIFTEATITPNSIVIDEFGKTTQFITSYYGSPDEVMSTFDLHCCRVALTPDKKLLYHKTWTNHATVDFANISEYILPRLSKYATRTSSKFDPLPLIQEMENNPTRLIRKSYELTPSAPITDLTKSIPAIRITDHLVEIYKALSTLPEASPTIPYFFTHFISNTVLQPQYQHNYSPYIEARLCSKTESRPTQKALDHFPEYFI